MDNITYVPVAQPPLKPLESWWWEDDTMPEMTDEQRRFIEKGEAQRLQDAEEAYYHG